MRPLILFLCILSSITRSGSAAAQRPARKASPAPTPPASSTATESGVGCRYRLINGAPSTIKDCGVAAGGGEFAVRIARGQAIVVRTDERISTVVPARSPEIRIMPTEHFVVYDLVGDLPKAWAATIQTNSYTVTLRFYTTTGAGDSQLHITRADRVGRDAELERRVAEEKARLKKDFDRRYADLDAKAGALARSRLVAELQRGWGSHDPDLRPAQNDFVVLRAERVIRIGELHFLQISIENRDRPVLHLGQLNAWIEQGHRLRSTPITWRCATTALRPSQRTRCTLAFDTVHDRVRIRAVSRDGRRSVTLAGIDLR